MSSYRPNWSTRGMASGVYAFHILKLRVLTVIYKTVDFRLKKYLSFLDLMQDKLLNDTRILKDHILKITDSR
jgi:hypothetical protein